MITFHATIHDSLISLLCNTLFGYLGIYPIRETPHLRVDLSIFIHTHLRLIEVSYSTKQKRQKPCRASI